MEKYINGFGHVIGLMLAVSPLIIAIYAGVWFDSTASLNNAYDYMCDNNISYQHKEYVLHCAERKYNKQLGLEK